MATEEVDEEEDVLTCSVCLDSYTDPCTLQCKHSFCRRCITKYVKTQADTVQNKTFPCPSCRQVTRVPHPSRPVDESAGLLQPGHVKQEMMARVNKDIEALSESVDTRVEQDKKDPYIRDITVLEVEGVQTTIVTDLDNKCVKSFYTRNNKTCHCRLQLDGEPLGITQLGNNKVMVAVPCSYQIVTVAMTPDLLYETCINTNKRYTSLVVMSSSRLAAGGYKCNDSVEILNMQGEVMKSVTTHNNMELFDYPGYMCISNTGHLLVSDWGKKTVTCLTSEGQTVWIYSGTGRGKLINPKGITTTGGGDIFVVDMCLKKVIQLSESGEYVRDVLTSHDGLSDPRGICVDKHGSLYICDSGKVLKFVFIRK